MAVQIQNVSKSFGAVEVLRDVTLPAEAGEFLTLLGPSGCGKSTLLRIIAGLEVQDVGSVSIAGQVVDGLPPKRRNVAMVFQSYALYPHMTVAGNIALPLIMTRLRPAQRIPLFGRLLPGTRAMRRTIDDDVVLISRSIEIEHLLTRMPGQLSGGQKQRVALARAMVRQPSVFLLDEPLSNLDANLRTNMRKELSDLHRRMRTTMIYVTHDQTEAMTMSDRVAVMSQGRVLQIATPRQIYADPDSLDVAKFIGSPSINVLPARAADGAVETLGVTIPFRHGTPAGTELLLGIRPEAVTVTPTAEPGAIPCVITQVEHLGPEAFVHTVIGRDHGVVSRMDAAGGAGLVVGQDAHMRFDGSRAVVFDRDGGRIRQAGI